MSQIRPTECQLCGKNIQVFSEHMTGLDFYFNASMIDSTEAPHIREILQGALKALDGG